jgi:hypothetical protein
MESRPPLSYEATEEGAPADVAEQVEKRATHDLATLTLESSRMQPEDSELVQCFEIKVPSNGRYKCPMAKDGHFDWQICEHRGCYYEKYGMILQDTDPDPLEYEKLPSSIVTVVKTHEYRPEACQRDYVDPDEQDVSRDVIRPGKSS